MAGESEILTEEEDRAAVVAFTENEMWHTKCLINDIVRYRTTLEETNEQNDKGSLINKLYGIEADLKARLGKMLLAQYLERGY